MDNQPIFEAFNALYSDIAEKDNFATSTPLLAHYTTIEAADKILTSNQLWLSNPLYMNDYEEVRFALIEGDRLFRTSAAIPKACGTNDRWDKLLRLWDHYFRNYIDKDLSDTYVLCFSNHHRQNNDGLLSMWRGYGGNGNGVALVFDTAKLADLENSPLILSAVNYGTREDRTKWIATKIEEFCGILVASNCLDDQLYVAAFTLFERLKLFALFTKHIGFEEEQEWRVVYLRERDRKDLLVSMLDYAVSPRGISPKLKFEVKPLEGVTAPGTNFKEVIDRIILGPSVSAPISVNAFKRLLQKTNLSEVCDRVFASTIPFRSLN